MRCHVGGNGGIIASGDGHDILTKVNPDEKTYDTHVVGRGEKIHERESKIAEGI